MHPTERLQAIWVTLFGATGSNGMRGELAEQRRKLTELEKRLLEHDRLRAQIQAIALMVQWIGLAVGAVTAFLLSTPVASLLAGWLRGALGPPP